MWFLLQVWGTGSGQHGRLGSSDTTTRKSPEMLPSPMRVV
eukprot:COSAG02_NODE_42920_length_380_cov_0.448399_1_plen_39_part_10